MGGEESSVDEAVNVDVIYHEKKARLWDRLVTIAIVIALFMPLPFARFETWPKGIMVAQHVVMPWSNFRLCYTSYPDGEPVEDVYRFTWQGEVLPKFTTSPHLLSATTLEVPGLKWQNGPELLLREMFSEGELLEVQTFWQPVIFWPLKMGWRIKI
jgi:hypothetical protein